MRNLKQIDVQPSYILKFDSRLTDEQVEALRDEWLSIYCQHKPYEILSVWDYTHEPYPRLRALDA